MNTGVSGPKSKNGVRTVTERVRTSRYSSVKLPESPVLTGLPKTLSPETSRTLRSLQVPEYPVYTGDSGLSFLLSKRLNTNRESLPESPRDTKTFTGVSGEHRRL